MAQAVTLPASTAIARRLGTRSRRDVRPLRRRRPGLDPGCSPARTTPARRRRALAAARHRRLGPPRSRPMTPTPIDEVVDLLRTLHCPTCAPQHQTCWPPPSGSTLGTGRSDAVVTAHRGRSPAAKHPRSGPGAKRAGFPTGKTFDAWDEVMSSLLGPGADPAGAAHPGVDPPSREPRRVRTIRHRQDPLLRSARPGRRRRGPQGHLVQFSSTSGRSCAARRRRHRRQSHPRIMRADVIVIDDIGLRGRHRDRRSALPPVDAAYEKRSIALSSNLHPAGFDELMPKTIANATVDRLLHHAHIVK